MSEKRNRERRKRLDPQALQFFSMLSSWNAGGENPLCWIGRGTLGLGRAFSTIVPRRSLYESYRRPVTSIFIAGR